MERNLYEIHIPWNKPKFEIKPLWIQILMLDKNNEPPVKYP